MNYQTLRNSALLLPRVTKLFVVVAVDILLSILAVWLSYSLRLDVMHLPTRTQYCIYLSSPITLIPIFYFNGLYRAIFRYSGLVIVIKILRSILFFFIINTGILISISWLGYIQLQTRELPRSIFLLCPIILMVLLCGIRLLAHAMLTGISLKKLKRNSSSRVLIYGAGNAGIQLSEAIMNSRNFIFLGFIDDNPILQGREINGNRIYSFDELNSLIYQMGVTDIILAIPGLSRARRVLLVEKLLRYSVHVRSIPKIDDLASGAIKVSDVKELDPLDLLGRPEVKPDVELLSKNILNKVVMITGAGGSIGGELSRQILRLQPNELIIIDSNEFSLYKIEQQLTKLSNLNGKCVKIFPILISILDFEGLNKLFETYKPNTIFHAAAYKHVPLVERNPIQGLKNNILGTLNLVKLSLQFKIDKFVLISTDKAVRPTNIMGASKRISEIILQANAAQNPATIFCSVRFGNVLDSSGSVVPLFREQILEGGPITLTHKDVTRYFMTIPEASQLVIQACSMARGGEVFVLDMGDPVKIFDLAVRMIELSGLKIKTPDNPSGDIEIKVTGLRPGEKLYEELLIGENPKPTDHPKIMMACEPYLNITTLEEKLFDMMNLMDSNAVERIIDLLSKLPISYKPN